MFPPFFFLFFLDVAKSQKKGGGSVLQILLKIALKLQIGKDYDKKEQEYQKYIYYASNGTNIMANQVKSPIQNYFEKCCMAIWHLRFLPCGFFRVE